VQIYSWGEHDGQPYFVLEFVAGGSLERRLGGQPQPPRDAAGLVLLLARAMHIAHQKGIIHRDLKPANILLGPAADEPVLNSAYGCPRITDFGLARCLERGQQQTASGTVMGTASYMAPEQASGQRVGPAADVYALGVILYEMLTGAPPFEGPVLVDVLMRVCTEPPPAPSTLQPGLPPDLEKICLRCLQKEPAARYPTAAALADDLRCFLGGDELAPTVPVLPRTRRPRRWLLPVGLAGAVLLGVVLVGPWSGKPPVGVAPTEAIPLKGFIDLRMSRPQDPRRQLLRLADPAARPLRAGDEVRVEAEVTRPAYLYVLWIDTQGKVLPVYPWREGEWSQRPEPEEPVQRLRLPEKAGDVWPIQSGPAGMETLALLVRETPLPREDNLEALLGELGPQLLQDPQDVAWFENGAVVRGEKDRAANLKNPQPASNPLLGTQALLWEKLQPKGTFLRAVSFGNLGGP
jgi:hypothetical protein